MGLEVPNPLNIEIARGTMDFRTICRDILSLTKLNYNACMFADGLPVTLRFADSIGEILTAGINVKTDVLTFKHYI
jgi:argonaute-like protein implicated in RNA metabolism and viral defense